MLLSVVAPVAVNVICADVMFVVPEGADVITSAGAMVSTSHV